MVPTKNKNKKNRVPFFSSSEKKVNYEPRAYTPGPGSYIDIFEKQRSVYNPIQSSSFASNCDRFSNKAEEVPGPGTYDVNFSWVSQKNSNKSDSSMNWVRLPSAPSIPNTALGYEENEQGELIMVKPGRDQDNIGPGYYNPRMANKIKGIKWMPPKTNVVGGFVSKYPGPGSYDTTISQPKYKEKPSAPFVNKEKKTIMIYQESEKDVPGPGKYLLNSKLGSASNPYAAQNFGSGCERFRSRTPDVSYPGPGSYKLDESFLFTQEPKVPFQSSRPRFVNKKDDRPGPGSYEAEDAFKKTGNKFNVLGGNEPRFIYNNEDTPGPGAYTVQVVGKKNSAKIKGLSVFESKSKRLSSNSDRNTPAPGSYEVAGKMGEVKQVGSVINPVLVREGENKIKGFNVQSNRFTSSRSQSPGPGTYKPLEPKSSRRVVFHKYPRFKNQKSNSPGPGAYPENHSWNKKTFNALFENKIK